MQQHNLFPSDQREQSGEMLCYYLKSAFGPEYKNMPGDVRRLADKICSEQWSTYLNFMACPRRISFTDFHGMITAPEYVQEGDVVVVPLGKAIPMILRKTADHTWTFQCYAAAHWDIVKRVQHIKDTNPLAEEIFILA
ncbi:hypothetical protein CLAFUW4_14453 [Fulvia fulva]|uniref:Uncharacterized protein n=1 Tax=Passalora fulva TaxID=5499 RepID=A0A9Q8UWA2_PASFU|nr:uncharacterized protein CLAFUR5_14285 [Fulvia fulva]KAK4609311.1 hypothetical protein CLAFUR4_14448 [Fulvia fulva]KAK4609868.1 hypothetical protein CLAFUR0_14450 [Fulvia fulva]UJO24834.1 hypothetical protein CLAFUR5_14285 [Fulvia fulva]WPV22599.1 hypothetical protein CLAFUW4_14453 [Fulvia fulva]WPV37394.1 hypothetical protein CLAFUW7_14457 [Fulvia fulva]